MGGCKCSFQDCGMSTAIAKKVFQNRDIHFFHFPIRDLKRAAQWAIYSNNMPFLELPLEKLKNKVICDLHFAEVCFMNQKREKLNKTNAIPTYYIDSDNKEVDMMLEPMPWVEENEKKEIPTSFFTGTRITIDEPTKIEIDETLSTKPVIQGVKRKSETSPPSTGFKILNSRVMNSSGPSHNSPLLQRVKKLPTISTPGKVASESYTIRRITSTNPQNKPKVIKSEVISPQTHFDIFDVSDLPVQFCPDESESEVPVEKSQVPQPPPPQPADDLKPILLDSLKQIADLKKIIEEKKSVENSTQKKETSNISTSHLNKVQLFNGIKRYLSPSMNALLRIELFSNPSREYKKDEKIICQELLDLGDKTYDFFTDEWRLRLPAKSEVEQWKLAQSAEDEDDAC